jgi:hypothetical protein
MKISLLLGLLALTLHAEGQHTYETGTLRCSVYGRANAYSHFPVRIGEKAYSLAVEIEDVVFLATELGSGAFATRRFDPDEWIIGDKVQVSLDEAKHKICCVLQKVRTSFSDTPGAFVLVSGKVARE